MLTRLKVHRGKIFLVLILLLTAFLTLYKVRNEGYGNEYYTAAVKNMLTSWHNFFYVSFDKGGFVSVDKPPLGLWLQCLFALIFGLHGWSVILPEALCMVASVAVLYFLVKKRWGELTALLSALFMAVTPIAVAVSRTNNLDPILTLVCLLAVWAALAAAERGSLKLLILSMALIGVGFNVKMMQAFMFLPAVYLVYFFTAETKLTKRIAHLAIGTVVLAAVSLVWCAAVDLTPAVSRPFVGSSATNSALDLALGYNGILRALPIKSAALESLSGAISQVPNEGAKAGILRFFNREMAGQASWLMPLAVFGLIALFVKLFGEDKAARRKTLRELFAWGGTFAVMFGYFSVSDHIHRYYLIMFAPCLAVLSAAAVTEFCIYVSPDGKSGKAGWKAVLLPLAFASSAATQLYILLGHYARFSTVLVPILAACTAVCLVLLVLFGVLKYRHVWLKQLALAIGLAGLLAAPAYWSYTPIRYGTNVITPFAGPPAVSSPTDDGEAQPMTYSWERKWFEGASLDGELIPKETMAYLNAHDNGSRYLVALPNVMFSAPAILEYGVSTMTVGGFVGTDRTVTVERFEQMAKDGEIQYYYAMFGAGGDVDRWVAAHGKKVDPALYSKNPRMQFYTIYDVSGLKTEG